VRCDPEIQELRQWQKKIREDKHIRQRVKIFWAKQEQKYQDLNQGNGTTHSGQVFSSIEPIEATPHMYTQGSIFQVILDFIK
ncbi:hypothetical protein STEG23_024767, partial [Scotinomys teguina]